ncbi:hypothetical protein LTR53_016585 [Teratosphaeriaceae sp. CCFEE 6253]|nr:hypothetical protein LTR53_016585 [Teratosphaeriaceae sp. CCFEE 6253]
MSFLKKLTKEFNELKSSFSDEPKKEQAHTHPPPNSEQRDGGLPSHGHEQQQCGQPHGHQQQSYGGETHGFQPPPPPQASHGGPPSLPPGWIMEWDASSQRNYYVETATGKTQWDPPHSQSHYPPPPQQHGPGGYAAPPLAGVGPYGSHDSSRGAADHYADSQRQYNQGYGGAPGYNPHAAAGPYDPRMGGHPEKKDNSTRNMVLAGGAGLAGGALLANAFDDDDEHHNSGSAQQQQQQQGYTDPDAPPPADAPLPTRDEDGDSVSGSDRESVQDAQEDVRDAQEEVAEASSESDRESAQEELEEAQGEYREEYEETYED